MTNTYRILIHRSSPRHDEVAGLVANLGGTVGRRGHRHNPNSRTSFKVTCTTDDARRFTLLGAQVKVEA